MSDWKTRFRDKFRDKFTEVEAYIPEKKYTGRVVAWENDLASFIEDEIKKAKREGAADFWIYVEKNFRRMVITELMSKLYEEYKEDIKDDLT